MREGVSERGNEGEREGETHRDEVSRRGVNCDDGRSHGL